MFFFISYWKARINRFFNSNFICTNERYCILYHSGFGNMSDTPLLVIKHSVKCGYCLLNWFTLKTKTIHYSWPPKHLYFLNFQIIRICIWLIDEDEMRGLQPPLNTSHKCFFYCILNPVFSLLDSHYVKNTICSAIWSYADST